MNGLTVVIQYEKESLESPPGKIACTQYEFLDGHVTDFTAKRWPGKKFPSLEIFDVRLDILQKLVQEFFPGLPASEIEISGDFDHMICVGVDERE